MKMIPRQFDMIPKKSQAIFEDGEFIVMPKNAKRILLIPKVSKWSVVPFVAAILIFMFLLQGLVYVGNAKNAQGEILGAATSAYSDLSAAGASFAGQNFSEAQTKFTDALNNLQTAQNR